MKPSTRDVVLHLLKTALEEARKAEYRAKASAGEGYGYLDRIADERASWSRRVEEALTDFQQVPR